MLKLTLKPVLQWYFWTVTGLSASMIRWAIRSAISCFKALLIASVKFRAAWAVIDMVARFGGDEFALLITDASERSDVVAIVEEILKALSKPFTLAGHEVFIDASMGLVCGRESDSAERLLRDADVAMYQAKGSRAGYCWF